MREAGDGVLQLAVDGGEHVRVVAGGQDSHLSAGSFHRGRWASERVGMTHQLALWALVRGPRHAPVESVAVDFSLHIHAADAVQRLQCALHFFSRRVVAKWEGHVSIERHSKVAGQRLQALCHSEDVQRHQVSRETRIRRGHDGLLVANVPVREGNLPLKSECPRLHDQTTVAGIGEILVGVAVVGAGQSEAATCDTSRGVDKERLVSDPHSRDAGRQVTREILRCSHSSRAVRNRNSAGQGTTAAPLCHLNSADGGQQLQLRLHLVRAGVEHDGPRSLPTERQTEVSVDALGVRGGDDPLHLTHVVLRRHSDGLLLRHTLLGVPLQLVAIDGVALHRCFPRDLQRGRGVHRQLHVHGCKWLADGRGSCDRRGRAMEARVVRGDTHEVRRVGQQGVPDAVALHVRSTDDLRDCHGSVGTKQPVVVRDQQAQVTCPLLTLVLQVRESEEPGASAAAVALLGVHALDVDRLDGGGLLQGVLDPRRVGIVRDVDRRVALEAQEERRAVLQVRQG